MAGTLRQTGRGSAYHISAAETNQVKTGSGILKTVFCVDDGTTFALAIYDSATTTENQMAAITATTGDLIEINMPFAAGLRVVSSGTPGRYTLSFE